MRKKISVIIPIFNEEESIYDFLTNQLDPILIKIPYEFEVILVNDGSLDGTLGQIRKYIKEKKMNIKLISLMKNFGKEIALSAGLQYTTSDAAIMIDADGQHPVEMIPLLIDKWEEGARIVTTVREENTTKHKIGSKFYYFLMRRLGNKNVKIGATDFRLLDREIIDEYNKFTERNRLARGLIDWLGVPQEYVKIKTKKRIAGKPTYSLKRLSNLTIDSLVSSSRTPLLIFGYIGLVITFISLMLGLFILIQKYILGDPLGLNWSGAAAVSVFVSFLVGLVLVSQAITALYVSQIHTESKNRPLFIIDKKESIGLNQKKKEKKKSEK